MHAIAARPNGTKDSTLTSKMNWASPGLQIGLPGSKFG